jgi:hypothetical protein
MGTAWKDWERRCADDLEDATGEPVERVGYAQSARTETRDADLRTELPLAVECRTGKGSSGVSLRQAVADAVEAAPEGEIPVAAVQRRHGRGQPQDRWAVLRWEDFCWLTGQWWAARQGGRP